MPQGGSLSETRAPGSEKHGFRIFAYSTSRAWHTGGLQKGLLNPRLAYASTFLIKRNNNKVLDGGTETWDRLRSLGKPVKPTAGSTERVALHPYPACYSVPIKRAPLSGAKEAQCPGTASGHAGFFCLGENPNNRKVGQLLSSLHPKLYLHITLINYANGLLGHDVGLAHG